MEETPGSQTVSTKLARIAQMARGAPDMAFTTLAHHIDIDWMREAYRRTRKDGASGVDGQSAEQYAIHLEDNLRSLLQRAKSGDYRAPAVRRVHIPKGDGSQTRPIGIPTFEDKVLQRAVAMVLEAVYEQDFLDCSYGFRPGRSAHDALDTLREGLMQMHGRWVLDVDIRKFFDTIDHARMQEILRRRIRDGVLVRLIGKWLHAGVVDAGQLSYPEAGTPQGGVISPLLANVYLHEVLDTWFEREVRPRLRKRAFMVRYADDFVMVFALKDDAQRVLEVLPKRFGRFGLALHPDKTRLVKFIRPPRDERDEPPRGGAAGTFHLLGFVHHWGRSRLGSWVVKRQTASDRLTRSAKRVWEWCREHLHLPVREQHRVLSAKLRGHYGYFGITCNSRALNSFYRSVTVAWRYWLDRRSQNARMNWARMGKLLAKYPLPMPRIAHPHARP